MQVKHSYLCFTAFTYVLQDVWFMFNFVTVQVLMEWFRKEQLKLWFVDEMLWHEASLTHASTIVCNILQEHKNKYMHLFASPEITWSPHWYSICQYLVSNGRNCNTWFDRYVGFLIKTSTRYLLVVGLQLLWESDHDIFTYSTLYQERKL